MYDVEESFNRYSRELGSRILFSPSPGETIKDIRRSIEVSQDSLSELLLIRRETVSRIETGVINPTTTFIKRFSKIASIIKVFRDLNALQDTPASEPFELNATFLRTHFSLTQTELDTLLKIGNRSYQKTKNKVLRRIQI